MSLPASNYTQVPNIVLDSMADLSHAEFKVIMAICRKTLGWQKAKEKLSISYLMELTGLSNQGVIRATKALMERGWIGREEIKVKRGYSHEYYLLLEPEDSGSAPVPSGHTMEDLPVTLGHTCDIKSHVTSGHSMTSSHTAELPPVTSSHTTELPPVTSSHRSKETLLSFKETPLEKETPNPLTPCKQGDAISSSNFGSVPLQPESEPHTETLDNPNPSPISSVAQSKVSAKTKSSGRRSQSKRHRSKAGRAERIYRQLEDDLRYESGKFYQWFDWYKRRLCEPYGKAHGDKAGAAAAWMNLVDSGVDLQQVSAGSSQYLGWVRASPDSRSCEIPHAHNFLEGKRGHPTPYWKLALEDAVATPVASAEFVAEPAPTMTRQEWSKRLGTLLRETSYLLPDASRDCPSTHYVTSAIELSADELPAMVMWLEAQQRGDQQETSQELTEAVA